MAKYAYPAIFTPEEDGCFSITFPDLEGCHTCGDSLEDGIEMAEDALALTLYGYEKEGKAIPTPSAPSAFTLSANDFVNFIAYNSSLVILLKFFAVFLICICIMILYQNIFK